MGTKVLKRYKEINGVSVYSITTRDNYEYFKVVCEDCKNKFYIYPPTKLEKSCYIKNNQTWEIGNVCTTFKNWKDLFKLVGLK